MARRFDHPRARALHRGALIDPPIQLSRPKTQVWMHEDYSLKFVSAPPRKIASRRSRSTSTRPRTRPDGTSFRDVATPLVIYEPERCLLPAKRSNEAVGPSLSGVASAESMARP